MLYLTLKRLVSHRFIHVSLCTNCLPRQKIMQNFRYTYLHVQTDSGQLSRCLAGRPLSTDVQRPCTYTNVHWNISVSPVTHVSFNYAWVEYCPVTLSVTHG